MIFFDLVFYKAKPKQGQRCHFVKFPFQVLQISLTNTILPRFLLLILIHLSDDNVHYQQTMMVTRALEEEDVLFQQIAYPDENHGIVGLRPHFYHTLSNFILNDCFGKNVTRF